MTVFNPLSANLTKWSNTLKQFIGNLPGEMPTQPSLVNAATGWPGNPIIALSFVLILV